MKRISNLYNRIISMDNLRLADKNSSRGRSKKYGVKVHLRNREKNLEELHERLLLRKFKTSPYKIDLLEGEKTRVLYKLPHYPDHILEYAIVQVLEPIWIKSLPFNTYSCIKGRGIHGAMKRVKAILKDRGKSKYGLVIDITKFYPSIVHDVAKRIIRRKIKCKDTLALLDEIIDSVNGYPNPLNLQEVCNGSSIPIGRFLSPYIANLVLGYMLHKINETGIKGVVYADDGVFFSDSKEKLHKLRVFIENYLRDELKLSLKGNFQVFPIAENRYDKHGRGIDFVGFVFYRNQTLMRKKIKKNFCRATSQLNKRSPPAKEYKKEICSWLGWAKYTDSRNLLRKIIKPNYYEACVL